MVQYLDYGLLIHSATLCAHPIKFSYFPILSFLNVLHPPIDAFIMSMALYEALELFLFCSIMKSTSLICSQYYVIVNLFVNSCNVIKLLY